MRPEGEDGMEGEQMDGSGGRREPAAEPVPAATPEGDDPQPRIAGTDDASSDTSGSQDPGAGDSSAQAGAADSDSAGDSAAGRRPPKRGRSFWRELPVLIAVALVLALVIKTYALQAFFIPSGSMENTLDIGDRVLINKLAYDFGSIHRGDVVVFDGAGSWDPQLSPPSGNPIERFFTNIGQMVGLVHGEDDYVKRVIGLPGDRVVCCDAKGRVTVNGVALNEASYLYPGNAPSTERFNIVVPQGCVWVMGDHREISYDSRDHTGDPCGGAVPESAVLGQVFVRIWPPSRWGFIGVPGTFGQPRLNSALGSAIDSGKLRADPSSPQFPLVLGFAGAVPVTLLTRRLRLRRTRRLDRIHQRGAFLANGQRSGSMLVPGVAAGRR
jgi:signal peptidase I